MIEIAIAEYLGIDVGVVLDIARKAPKLYRRYRVPKPAGGFRDIYHPAKETKTLQIAAINLLDDHKLISECVYGYVRGLKSPLLQNAKRHTSMQYLLKLDFNNYFPSIKPDDFIAICSGKLSVNGLLLTGNDIGFLSELFFVFNSNANVQWFLGIGAPSSPFVSNWVMYDLDRKISELAIKFNVVYTRYADDLCFSSNSRDNILLLEEKVTELVAVNVHPKLTFNDKKRRFSSVNTKRRVCGLTITPTGEVKVPREFKRVIRSMLFRYKHGLLSQKELEELSGYLGYVKDCDPLYLNNLALKYASNYVYSAMTKKEFCEDNKKDV